MFVPTFAAMLAVFYGGISAYQTEEPNWSKARLVAYTALSRPVWSLGLCILCVLWFANRRNPLSAMLSAGFWYDCISSCRVDLSHVVTPCALHVTDAGSRSRG